MSAYVTAFIHALRVAPASHQIRWASWVYQLFYKRLKPLRCSG
jgi:hypothetical protein